MLQQPADLRYAESRYKALSEALKSDAVSRMEVEQGHSILEQCKANLKAAKAALETAQTQLSYCTVRAPFDGHVSSAIYDVGSYLGGEGEPVPLADIYADATMIAIFSIDDADALADLQHNIKSNAVDYKHIPISFNDTLGHTYTASLDYLAPRVDTSTGTIQIQALIDNKYGELRSGMYASIDLPTGALPDAVLVKEASLSTDQLGKYLYVVNDSNKVVYTPVKIGASVRDSLRIINQGISPSERYVTKAMLKVRDGITVKTDNRKVSHVQQVLHQATDIRHGAGDIDDIGGFAYGNHPAGSAVPRHHAAYGVRFGLLSGG